MSVGGSGSFGAGGTPPPRRWRAGDAVEDACRVCKDTRRHTVIVADGDGRPARVLCDTCSSQHDYRGGGARASGAGSPGAAAFAAGGSGVASPSAGPPRAGRDPIPIVTDRERRYPGMDDLELLLRRIVREEMGVTPVTPAEKWRGGEVVLKPGKPGVQEKSIPIETLFNKVVMIRNRLRVLEQQVNGLEIDHELKLKLQGYITGCYGSLTTLNVLFADEDDKFKGSE